MDPMDTEHVKQFEVALGLWEDSRFISRDDVRTAAMFVMYLVNLSDHAGWTYTGHSWREAEHLGCLVVKGVVGGVPSVVFTSANTLIGGMRTFLRKFDGDFLEWIPDKYAR